MGIDTSLGNQSRWEGAQNYYGGQDLQRDLGSMSNSQIKAQMAANPGRFRDQSTIDRINALGADPVSGGGGGGGGGGYVGGSVGAGAGAFNPNGFNFNPGGINLGGGPSWSNDDFIAGLARERSQEYINNDTSTEGKSIKNNIVQNVGNKGDWESNVTNNGTISNASIGNDYSLSLGNINLSNSIT